VKGEELAMSQLTERMMRAAKLESALYEEVEADKSALTQAMAVVVLSSVAAGIGAVAVRGVGGILTGTIGALVGWYLWAFVTYFIGTRLLPQPQTHADVGELLRTTGFSSSPGVLRIFGFIPALGPVIVLASSVWMLIAMVIAVRQALDYTSTLRAVGVCIIGWFAMLLLTLLLGGLAGALRGAG
jgi:hypothetical protein